MVTATLDNLAAARSDTAIEAVVADAGYYSEANASLEGAGEVMIPPLLRSVSNEVRSPNETATYATSAAATRSGCGNGTAGPMS
jgi:hypothetical protein